MTDAGTIMVKRERFVNRYKTSFDWIIGKVQISAIDIEKFKKHKNILQELVDRETEIRNQKT
jgi:hypothetical protein